MFLFIMSVSVFMLFCLSVFVISCSFTFPIFIMNTWVFVCLFFVGIAAFILLSPKDIPTQGYSCFVFRNCDIILSYLPPEAIAFFISLLFRYVSNIVPV